MSQFGGTWACPEALRLNASCGRVTPVARLARCGSERSVGDGRIGFTVARALQIAVSRHFMATRAAAVDFEVYHHACVRACESASNGRRSDEGWCLRECIDTQLANTTLQRTRTPSIIPSSLIPNSSFSATPNIQHIKSPDCASARVRQPRTITSIARTNYARRHSPLGIIVLGIAPQSFSATLNTRHNTCAHTQPANIPN